MNTKQDIEHIMNHIDEKKHKSLEIEFIIKDLKGLSFMVYYIDKQKKHDHIGEEYTGYIFSDKFREEQKLVDHLKLQIIKHIMEL